MDGLTVRRPDRRQGYRRRIDELKGKYFHDGEAAEHHRRADDDADVYALVDQKDAALAFVKPPIGGRGPLRRRSEQGASRTTRTTRSCEVVRWHPATRRATPRSRPNGRRRSHPRPQGQERPQAGRRGSSRVVVAVESRRQILSPASGPTSASTWTRSRSSGNGAAASGSSFRRTAREQVAVVS